jgi:hypothetical protein
VAQKGDEEVRACTARRGMEVAREHGSFRPGRVRASPSGPQHGATRGAACYQPRGCGTGRAKAPPPAATKTSPAPGRGTAGNCRAAAP